ncbi:glycoside hydrolase family 3 protein, partial [Micromonospora sp. STR1s_6]|nr:glycoside hydrolase family 3 protein [Micromonospora tarensis]
AWTRAAGGSTVTADTELGYAAARRAVRVDGLLTGLEQPLVVQLHTESTMAEGRVPWGLGPHLDGVPEIRVIATETDPATLRGLAGDRPVVLVGRHLHRLPGGPELIAGLAAQHPVTVVEMGWPAQWRPTGVRAFVTTYGASHANGRAAAEVLGLAKANRAL